MRGKRLVVFLAVVLIFGLLVGCSDDDTSARYEKTLANQAAIEDILTNPESYGSEEEVIDRIGELAAPGAVMEDEVFGAVEYKTAFANTLYSGNADARIDIHHSWLSDDGSQGGFLWTWRGTNAAGNDFELAGISLDEYDEEGLITHELVVYPHSSSYVMSAFLGSGTALTDSR